MFLRYFGLDEDPFGSTPDPRWLYSSPTHQEALASLMYGHYTNRGFTALIAPPGLGKTTLLFRFLDDIRTSARTVFLFDALCEPLELLSYMLRDLGIIPGHNGVEMREQLKEVLVSEARAGKRFVVVIDEAQNMSDDSLEMVRLLTNFETPRAKLMQIVLSGQPKLADKLMRPSLEQLRQRISTFCRLEPLSEEQTAAYIDHRLKRAGYAGPQLFTEDARKLLTDASRGIPRMINTLCFNALTLTCALRRKQVDALIAAEAIADQQLRPESKELFPVVPEIVTQPKIESEEPEHSGSAVKPWAVAVLLVASVLSALAFPKMAPLWSHTKAEVRKLFVKGPSSPQAVQAATEISEASVTESNSGMMSFQVVVGPNERLSDIAVKYLGNFDQERLHQILALNPKLIDPDHIEVGQTLRLPGTMPAKQPDTEISASDLEFQPKPTAVSTAKAAVAGSRSKADSFEVTVKPNQTLQDIAVKYLGDFDLKRLHQIQTLNPKLTDPDHIETGQKIRLPGSTRESVAPNATSLASVRKLP